MSFFLSDFDQYALYFLKILCYFENSSSSRSVHLGLCSDTVSEVLIHDLVQETIHSNLINYKT